MTATAVIAEIEKLPSEERKKVFAYVEAALDNLTETQPGELSIDREKARAVRRQIFKTNAELLRKLAQ